MPFEKIINHGSLCHIKRNLGVFCKLHKCSRLFTKRDASPSYNIDISLTDIFQLTLITSDSIILRFENHNSDKFRHLSFNPLP